MDIFFFFSKKKYGACLLTYSPFRVSLSRREATLCFSLSRYKSHKGRQIPPLHPIYIHTHTHSLSFFLSSYGSVFLTGPACNICGQPKNALTTNKSHTQCTHTHTYGAFFFSIPISPPL